MGVEAVKDDVASWLRRAGFMVSELPTGQAPGALWVLGAQLGGVRITVAGLGGVNALVFSIGIALSPQHAAAVSRLSAEERVRLSARVLRAIASVCPACRAGVQPSLAEPRAFVAQRILLLEALGPQTAVEYAMSLVNVYLAVNTVLWELAPQPGAGVPAPQTHV